MHIRCRFKALTEQSPTARQGHWGEERGGRGRGRGGWKAAPCFGQCRLRRNLRGRWAQMSGGEGEVVGRGGGARRVGPAGWEPKISRVFSLPRPISLFVFFALSVWWGLLVWLSQIARLGFSEVVSGGRTGEEGVPEAPTNLTKYWDQQRILENIKHFWRGGLELLQAKLAQTVLA